MSGGDRAGVAGGAAGRPLRVLLVEDNTVTAQVMCAILRHEGFDVAAVAHSGGEALAAIADGSFELAIVDLQLPDMEGDVLLSRMRDQVPGMRLVACSAHWAGSREVGSARRHVDAVIGKDELAESAPALRAMCRTTAGTAR